MCLRDFRKRLCDSDCRRCFVDVCHDERIRNRNGRAAGHRIIDNLKRDRIIGLCLKVKDVARLKVKPRRIQFKGRRIGTAKGVLIVSDSVINQKKVGEPNPSGCICQFVEACDFRVDCY